MEIKNEKIKFTISLELQCTDSDDFVSQSEFRDNDVKKMINYLTSKLQTALSDSWGGAAEVVNSSIVINSDVK